MSLSHREISDPQWASAATAANPAGNAKNNLACTENSTKLVPSLPVVLDSPVKKHNGFNRELVEARSSSVEKEARLELAETYFHEMEQAAKLIARFQQDIKEATKITNLAVEKAEEYRKRWFLAEHRAGDADAAIRDALKQEQEARNRVESLKSKLIGETSSKKEAQKRAVKAELAANEAAAEAEALIAKKDTQLKKLRLEKELSEKNAAQIEDKLTKALATAQKALQTAEKVNKSVEYTFQKELAAKNEQIKTLKASSKLAEETKSKANQLDYYKRLAIQNEERVKAVESYSAGLQAKINELYLSAALTRASHQEECNSYKKKIETHEDQLENYKQEFAMLEEKVHKYKEESSKLERHLKSAKEEYEKWQHRARSAEGQLINGVPRFQYNHFKSNNNPTRRSKSNIAQSSQGPRHHLFEGTPRRAPLTSRAGAAHPEKRYREPEWQHDQQQQQKRQRYEEPRRDLRDVFVDQKSRGEKEEQTQKLEKAEDDSYVPNKSTQRFEGVHTH